MVEIKTMLGVFDMLNKEGKCLGWLKAIYNIRLFKNEIFINNLLSSFSVFNQTLHNQTFQGIGCACGGHDSYRLRTVCEGFYYNYQVYFCKECNCSAISLMPKIDTLSEFLEAHKESTTGKALSGGSIT